MFAGHFNCSCVALLITISISILFCGVGFEALVPRRILSQLFPPVRGSFCPQPPSSQDSCGYCSDSAASVAVFEGVFFLKAFSVVFPSCYQALFYGLIDCVGILLSSTRQTSVCVRSRFAEIFAILCSVLLRLNGASLELRVKRNSLASNSEGCQVQAIGPRTMRAAWPSLIRK